MSLFVTHRGTIEGIPDFFVHTHVLSGGVGARTLLQTAQDVHSAWAGAFQSTSLDAITSSMTAYVSTTVAEIISLTEGTLSAGATYERDEPLPGTAVAPSLPANSACAVSTWGGLRSNGSRVKGRFYLPPFGAAALASNGRWSASAASSALNAVETYVTNLAANGDEYAVWSRSEASITPLSRIRVGDIPDVIRSRRNAEPEVYVETTL